MAKPDPETYLSTRQVADRLGYSLETIQGWIHRGWLRASRLTPGGHWRIPESALQEALQRAGQVRQRPSREVRRGYTEYV